jgi:hypothetical protein
MIRHTVAFKLKHLSASELETSFLMAASPSSSWMSRPNLGVHLSAAVRLQGDADR